MKKTILGVLITLLILGLAQIASAETIKGQGFEIEIDVDDDKVKPGESFTVEVDVTNNLSIDMEDIEVEVVIENIDDGDDLDDDGDIDDLEADEDDNIEFDFETPYAVDDKDYDIKVTVKGDAENGTKYEMEANATVEVEKDKHELIMKKPTFTIETLKCSRSTELAVTLYNIGTKDEDVELEVYNTELGINKKQTFDLDSGDDEDDIKTNKRVVLDLSDAEAKIYTFFVKANYDDGDEYESESLNLKVEKCGTAIEDEEDEVVIQTTPTTTPSTIVPAIVEEPTFMDKYGAALILGLAYVIVIVVGILLIVGLLRKRREE
jgi:hypothetical protein